MDVACHTSGSFLFGVKEYFPALMAYVDRYGIDLKFQSTLVAVDGAAKTATFKEAAGEITRAFDMIHVTPPQRAPEFVADSRSEEHTSELQSLMRISYAVFCLKKKTHLNADATPSIFPHTSHSRIIQLNQP